MNCEKCSDDDNVDKHKNLLSDAGKFVPAVDTFTGKAENDIQNIVSDYLLSSYYRVNYEKFVGDGNENYPGRL